MTRRTPSGRAIIYAGVLGGLRREQINELLHEVNLGDESLPQSSYGGILRNEVPVFLDEPAVLGEFIYHPQSRDWLAERKRKREAFRQAPGQTEAFVEELFAYRAEEYARWCSGDPTCIADLVARSGPMGKAPDTYPNQAVAGKGSQHFPEVTFGAHLVEARRFPRDCVFYENYYLSDRVFADKAAHGGGGLYLQNTRMLRQALAPAFFLEMDRRFEVNSALINRKTWDHLNVDICAIDFRTRRLAFVEVKKYSPGARETERVQPEQMLVLALIRNVVDRLGATAFVDGLFSVETKLVAFVDEGALADGHLRPKNYTVDYRM